MQRSTAGTSRHTPTDTPVSSGASLNLRDGYADEARVSAVRRLNVLHVVRGRELRELASEAMRLGDRASAATLRMCADAYELSGERAFQAVSSYRLGYAAGETMLPPDVREYAMDANVGDRAQLAAARVQRRRQRPALSAASAPKINGNRRSGVRARSSRADRRRGTQRVSASASGDDGSGPGSPPPASVRRGLLALRLGAHVNGVSFVRHVSDMAGESPATMQGIEQLAGTLKIPPTDRPDFLFALPDPIQASAWRSVGRDFPGSL